MNQERVLETLFLLDPPARAAEGVDDLVLADDLSAHLSGALGDRDGETLERAVAQDDALRSVFVSLREAHAASREAPPPQFHVLRVAALLAGVTLAALLLIQAGTQEGRGAHAARTVSETWARLETRAAALRRDGAAWLGPLPSLAGRMPPAPASYRDGLRILAPRGALLDGRPALRWRGMVGVATARFVVIDEGGRPRLDLEIPRNTTPWPAAAPTLPPGRYLLRVEQRTPLGAHSTAGSCEVLPVERAEALRALLLRLSSSSDEDAQRLAFHIALDAQVWSQARALWAALPEGPHKAHYEPLFEAEPS